MPTVTVTNQKSSFDADTNTDYPVDVGAGTVSTATQRITLASDDPAVTQLTSLAGEDFATEATLNAIGTDVGAIASDIATLAAEDFATETTLSALNAKVTACNTGAVVVSSSALPTGAATAANQQTDALTDAELRAAPVPVSLTSTTITGTVAVTQSGTWDEVGINDSGNSITVDDGGLSLTVDGTVAATQSGTWNITNVSGTVSLPTGAATLAEQQTQTTALQLIDDTVATLGTTTYTEATTKGLVIGAVRRDADTTLVNTTNEVAPLQVDANGRLKVEAFSGETLPVSLTSTTITGTVAVTQSGTWDEVGINDSGNSITVDDGGLSLTVDGTVAATQSGTWTVQPGNTANTTAWLVKEQRAATATQNTVNDSSSSGTILASNANRLGATIANDSSAVLYLRLSSSAATSTNYTVRMVQYSYYEVPFGYTGAITGIWASDPNDGGARVTEITA